MGDWFLNLPILWMALAIFAAAYLVAACVYLVTVRLAVGDRARAFKAFSPGMLPPLASSSACSSALSPWGSGTTSIKPSLRSPQKRAHYEPLFSAMSTSPKSRGCSFALSSIVT